MGQRSRAPPPRQMAHACVAICFIALLHPQVAALVASSMASSEAGTSDSVRGDAERAYGSCCVLLR
eukprot:7492496-Prorocentrum_lima.AAC.1